MDAFQLLVIILSVTLFIFLVLAIALLIIMIKISNQIKHITDTVGDSVDNIRDFTASISRLASPALLAKIVMQYVQKIKNKRKEN